MQKLSASLKEKGVDEARVKEILSGMKKYAGKIGKKFQEYEPYGGENVDAEDQMYVLRVEFYIESLVDANPLEGQYSSTIAKMA